MRNPLLLAITTALALSLTPMSGQIVMQVHSAVQYNPTGIFMSAGQKAEIAGKGIVNLADANGPYETDPAGTIFVAPAPGSSGYSFFQFHAAPIGVPPAKYQRKLLIPPQAGPLMYAPYGALVAGISPSANPQSEADFPNGFTYIGSLGSVLALSDGYLYLSVNDNFPPLDNQGSYFASIQEPE